MINSSESKLSSINENVFFKEFTFTKNDFIAPDTNTELEFSDNVVWLDDIFMIFEVKERGENSSKNDANWFRNKILNKATKQIKNAQKYLLKYPNIEIINARGEKRNINEQQHYDIQKSIVYDPKAEFDIECRQTKFYVSNDIGLIHLFHIEDYSWVCKFLITPSEIKEYLIFREELFLEHKEKLNLLPEQYVLGHFFETLNTSTLNPRYINNLDNYNPDLHDHDISSLMNTFYHKIRQSKDSNQYKIILAEIAKLNRAELTEFKKRYIQSIKISNQNKHDDPYRIFLPRTNCGFVFIPLQKKYSKHWKNALTNFTLAHQYDQKAYKCIGVIMYGESTELQVEYLEMNWLYSEQEWAYNNEIDTLLKDRNPFRSVKREELPNRYLD